MKKLHLKSETIQNLTPYEADSIAAGAPPRTSDTIGIRCYTANHVCIIWAPTVPSAAWQVCTA